jgi:hypothetical protein
MSGLTAEEEADLKQMEADYAKQAPLPKGEVRPERYADFAPGMGDDGKLFPVPAPVAPPKKP